ncbi:MAG: sugar ABC transporter permease [Clostridia bacterium]
MQRRMRALLPNQKSAPYYFIAPLFIIFSLFIVYPIVDSFIMSFQTFKAGKYLFAGLDNYATLVRDPVFLITLKNTLIYLIIQVPVMVVLSLGLASLLDTRGLRGKALFRTGLFLPSVTALVAYSLVFKLLLNADYGFINFLLSKVGIAPVDWLNSRIGARASIILSMTWRWTGYNMIIMIAGLQAIPQDIYEAASIDGASAWQKFVRITIPMMRSIILFVSVTSTIGTFQLFDESYVLTAGGPNNATITMAHYLYNTGFRYFKFGYAAAISYAMVLIILLLSVLQFKLGGDEDA